MKTKDYLPSGYITYISVKTLNKINSYIKNTKSKYHK